MKINLKKKIKQMLTLPCAEATLAKHHGGGLFGKPSPDKFLKPSTRNFQENQAKPESLRCNDKFSTMRKKKKNLTRKTRQSHQKKKKPKETSKQLLWTCSGS